MDINNRFFVTKCTNSAKAAYGHFATNLFSAENQGEVVDGTTLAGQFLAEVLKVAKNKFKDGAAEEMTNIYNKYKDQLKLSDDMLSVKMVIENSDKINSDKLRNLSTKTIEKFEANSNFLAIDGTAPAGEVKEDKSYLIPIIQQFKNFFTEFGVDVGARFLNTFCHCAKSKKRAYVINYFMTQDHPNADVIKDKTKSREFKDLCDQLTVDDKVPFINKRLKILYGPAGTGKTTKACQEATKVIVCASDMMPKNVMTTFKFTDGHPEFVPSELWLAIENGETILMDEFNMLPFETLRFLQGILDGKEEFNYEGHTLKIHPDFKIIATMNLDVQGQRFGLPEPLVDRAYEITEMTMTPEMLLQAIS